MAQHSLILNELLRTSRRVHQDGLVAPEDVPKFPLQTLGDFQNFDKLLEQNSALNDYMVKIRHIFPRYNFFKVSRLAAVGGSGVESLTRRIMKFLLSNEVAVLYNWKGRDKFPFEKTAVINVIYGKLRD